MTTHRKGRKIFLAGHSGLVGSAVSRELDSQGLYRVLKPDIAELDLRNQAAATRWFRKNKPELVIMAAGTVGGIWANSTRPAEFLYDNVVMAANVIHAAYENGVAKLLYLGSSCIYPRECPQPIKEEYLLTGPLEATNEGYALAKITGVKLCQTYRKQYGCHFISAMPTNLFGPFDNFDLNSSHVLPALIRKFHDAKVQGASEVSVWGSGNPRREFLYVEDLAKACVFLLEHYDEPTPINVGTGEDLSIRELAELVRGLVHPEAKIVFDQTKPDGTARKLLDVSRIHALGWRHLTPLKEGIEKTYRWYQEHVEGGGERR